MIVSTPGDHWNLIGDFSNLPGLCPLLASLHPEERPKSCCFILFSTLFLTTTSSAATWSWCWSWSRLWLLEQQALPDPLPSHSWCCLQTLSLVLAGDDLHLGHPRCQKDAGSSNWDAFSSVALPHRLQQIMVSFY